MHTIFTVFTNIVKPEPGTWRDFTLAAFNKYTYNLTTKMFKRNIRKKFGILCPKNKDHPQNLSAAIWKAIGSEGRGIEN